MKSISIRLSNNVNKKNMDKYIQKLSPTISTFSLIDEKCNFLYFSSIRRIFAKILFL